MRPVIPDLTLGTLGRKRPLLLVTTAAGVSAFPLRSAWVVLGNAPDCDVVIDDASVSPHHARIVSLAPAMLEDLGSEWGTRMLGVRLAPHQRARLPFGARFLLGDVCCILERRRDAARRARATTVDGGAQRR